MFIVISRSVYSIPILVKCLKLCSPTSKLCVKITFVCFVHTLQTQMYFLAETKLYLIVKVFFVFLIGFSQNQVLAFMLTLNYLLSGHQLTDNVLDAKNEEIKKLICPGEGIHITIPCGKCSQQVLIKDQGNTEKGSN